MKIQKIILGLLLSTGVLSGCEDKSYPAGLAEFDHHYYVVYLPNNNSAVTVRKNQAELLKLPVQFHSSFTRPYDAVAKYAVVKPNIANPASLGVDFQIVDKQGNTLQPGTDGKYSMVFPQAKKTTDTVYVKLLNNPAPGRRIVEINFEDNLTPEYRVDIFSTAFKRTLNID
jgi:hypothetical protein